MNLDLKYETASGVTQQLRTAINLPSNLLLNLWLEAGITKIQNDWTITYRHRDAVPDVMRYEYLPGSRFHEVQGQMGFLGATGFPSGQLVDRAETSVLLLLESPHKEETSGELRPRFPAAGATGKRIHGNLDRLQEMLDPICHARVNSRTPVILCNPVPHPASGRVSLGRNGWTWWKEFVYEALYPHIESEFKNRLRRYNPRVIINACSKLAATHGGTPDILPISDSDYVFVLPRPGARRGKPTSPKDLVAHTIQAYLQSRRLSFYRAEFTKGGSSFEASGTPSGDPTRSDVIWIDTPHPSSWWNR